MFLESMQHLLVGLVFRLENFSADQFSAIAVFVACTAVLLTWRIWTFTVVPILYPTNQKSFLTGFYVSQSSNPRAGERLPPDNHRLITNWIKSSVRYPVFALTHVPRLLTSEHYFAGHAMAFFKNSDAVLTYGR